MKSRAGLSVVVLGLFLLMLPASTASTTWYVDGVNGNDTNDCKSSTTECKTIGHAISLASSGDSISIAAATYTENLTIGISLKIIGAGASTTIVDGRHTSTVVTISNASASVTLSELTIQNGFCLLGCGGGINNNGGTLKLNQTTISGNNSGSAGYAASGGGINNGGTLTINNSTMSGNIAAAASLAQGGGIANFGILIVSNSTLSGNSASARVRSWGGGIYNAGTLIINNGTISGNSATTGGGIYNYSGFQATFQNNILASDSGQNCFGTMISNGYNLSSDATCNFNGPGDLNDTDPKLGPLQNNGGPTQTEALLSGSPAIDAGNPSGCTDGRGHLLKTDQRGFPRPDKEDTGGCDMGAYEKQTD